MSQRTARLGRSLLVILTMVAWFSISNHCALGAVMAIAAKTSVMQMHCHQGQPVPANGGPEQTPCCKVLKAVTIVKVDVGANGGDFVLKEFPAVGFLIAVLRAQPPTLGLNTGPPDAPSFSESVLQRSILAHAPPLLLS